MKDDRLYLIHILECIGRIEKYVSESSREKFFASSLVQDAVLRNLQVMAESTQRLSEELKAKYPDVPWYQIAGFRNVLVHDYLEVDIALVWIVIERELPPLKRNVRGMLVDLEGS